jgi:uroporphyrinogen decarboxylase
MTGELNMTGKQVLLDAIAGKRPSRTPVTLLSGGAWAYNNHGYTLDRILGRSDLAAGIIVEANRKVGSDAVWVGSGFNNIPIKALGGKLKFRARGTPDVQEPLLKSASDTDSIDTGLLKHDSDVASLWNTTTLVDREIGSTTLVGASGWGPFTLAAQMFGTERLMSAIYKDRAAVEAVLAFSVDVSVRYYQGFIERGARIISIGEPTASGDMISRRHFEQLTLPTLTVFMERLKGLGALNLLHICGNITDRLDLVADTGVDVLSVDFKVDLKRVKEVLGIRLAFSGNVNPVAVLQQGSPEEVSAVSRGCIEDGGDDGNFILMPGCDIPPGVPLENLKAFFATGKGYDVEGGAGSGLPRSPG